MDVFIIDTEEFFILPISNRFPGTYAAHKALCIDSDAKEAVWKVVIHSIMADIDELFEERDGIMVSKSVSIANLGVFEQFVIGHFKRVRYGKGRKRSKSVYVKPYWRSDGA